jgi:hypothetical protein
MEGPIRLTLGSNGPKGPILVDDDVLFRWYSVTIWTYFVATSVLSFLRNLHITSSLPSTAEVKIM